MKQLINLDMLDVNEEIDFEFIDEGGSDSMEPMLLNNKTTETVQESTQQKPKYVRKTIYINRDYLDVLEFFERKDSSVAICELLREALRKEKGLGGPVDLISIMEAINDLNNKLK